MLYPLSLLDSQTLPVLLWLLPAHSYSLSLAISLSILTLSKVSQLILQFLFLSPIACFRFRVSELGIGILL